MMVSLPRNPVVTLSEFSTLASGAIVLIIFRICCIQNYIQIKEDVEDIVTYQMERILNDPAMEYLIL
ncbi:hypothetical protein [Dyadobacter sp. CY312]|uniref:hypothetical protein n=1 Tax=Dyadobacter sp. CY312 TaxID=2907303 RepID=UPI001F453707|nr:hypothetical protein [Dyadobacter sp. CY312]MCE7042805.1 hypothetical protein [Dyadobacter sp. CY312]